MNTTITTRMMPFMVSPAGRISVLSMAMLLACWTDAALAEAARPLYDPPPLPIAGDDVLLVSTRAIGTVCDGQSISHGLRCQRLDTGATFASAAAAAPAGSAPAAKATWKTVDWRQVLSAQDQRPTIIYVHGNRVSTGQDAVRGLSVYRSFKAHSRASGPVRFVIWSWPSTAIHRPIKDYRVKAKRTTPVAWQLAWLIDKFPVQTPISLVGYSYGARVVSGTTHLLAGGALGDLRLTNRVHPERPPVRVALVAAAYDADWIQPGSVYGRALAQIDRLILTTNNRDPAMRFFHLSNGRGRMHALGRSGVHQPQALGSAARSALRSVDFQPEVGSNHALEGYLAADGKMSLLWRELTRPDPHAPVSAAVLPPDRSNSPSSDG